MYRLCFYFFFTAIFGWLASCKSTSVDPNSTSDSTFVKNNTDIKTYAVSKGLTGTTTDSGLFFALTKPSSSTVIPAFQQELEFTYKLYVLKGPSNTTVTSGVTDTPIDSAYAKTPIFFPFFKGALKPGLQEAFLMMHEGDQVTLLIPSKLAFGNVASPDNKVPPNSPLRYDITLNRARTEDQQIAEYLARNMLTPTEITPSGLRFIRTKSVVDTSANKIPTSDKTLTIRYTAKLLRYVTPYDSTGKIVTYDRTKKPTGFDEGLSKLRVGEKATLIVPSKIGYQDTGLLNTADGQFVVPPYSPLRYDIELVSAQ